jgi:hypothetical protein
LRKANITFVMSVCLSVCPLPARMEQLSSHWTNFHEILYLRIFRKSVEKAQFSLKSDNNNGTLRDDLCTFMIISSWILLRNRNVSDKSCTENQNTHFMFNTFLRKSCRLWDNVKKYGRARQATDDSIIQRMRFACWITKATDTHSECVILIAFSRQQWLRERAIILRYTYIDCLVCNENRNFKRIRSVELFKNSYSHCKEWDIILLLTLFLHLPVL